MVAPPRQSPRLGDQGSPRRRGLYAGAGSGATLRDPGPRPRERGGADVVRGHGCRRRAGGDGAARAGHRPGRAPWPARPDPVARTRAHRGAPPAGGPSVLDGGPRPGGVRTPAPAGVGACPTHWPAPLPGRSRSGGLKLVSSALAVRSCVPPLPAATVERPRLRAALDAHREGALTLVGAPPGWGKTVLLSGWAAEHGAAWLTLGPRHADARRLWLDVCDALTRADVSLDGVELPLEDAPLKLADALAGRSERVTLVLDDLDLLRGPALASLGELLVHGGEALHVVAATRSDPDLPLTRLRLSGRLGELRAADLAFTLEETTVLLEQLGLALRPDLVGRLLERTEGWAAGLRLAGLSLRGEADPDAFVAQFAGDDRAVADYLTGEVLAGLPAATRELLLRTSIAERICGGLADALTGAGDGALLLEELERSGAFVAPLDRQRTWFRYHGLFAELLRARLRLERPGLEPELHARAAVWLAAEGHGREAMPHALAADGPREAAHLVAEHWRELLLDGAAPHAIVAAADRAPGDARLEVSAAAACLTLGDVAGAQRRLAGIAGGGDDAVRLAGLLRARADGDTERAGELAAALLRDTGPGRDGDALRALT